MSRTQADACRWCEESGYECRPEDDRIECRGGHCEFCDGVGQ